MTEPGTHGLDRPTFFSEGTTGAGLWKLARMVPSLEDDEVRFGTGGALTPLHDCFEERASPIIPFYIVFKTYHLMSPGIHNPYYSIHFDIA